MPITPLVGGLDFFFVPSELRSNGFILLRVELVLNIDSYGVPRGEERLPTRMLIADDRTPGGPGGLVTAGRLTAKNVKGGRLGCEQGGGF